MNAFSYIRWSSAKQGKGDADSFARQTALAKTIADGKNWNLIELPPDAGISAWKGKNIHTGALGAFIQRIKSGSIETPCVLILEKLDRFSRADIPTVLPIFWNLLELGVEVYSHAENYHYTKEVLTDKPTETIISMLLGFVAANQYSKTLSFRVKSAKEKQIKSAIAGEKVYVESATPMWLDWIADKKEFHFNSYTAIIQGIFKTYLGGATMRDICRSLNDKQIKTPYGKQWSQPCVRNILQSKSAIGYYKTNPNYFPSIVSPEDFEKVQALILSRRTPKGRPSSFVNILQGLAVCSVCGKPLVMHANSTSTIRYLRCIHRYEGTCTATKQIPINVIEGSLFVLAIKSNPENLIESGQVEIKSTIQRLLVEKTAVTTRINKLLELEVDVAELKEKLNELKAKREAIDSLIKKEQSKIAPDGMAAGLAQLRSLLDDMKDDVADVDLAPLADTEKRNMIKKLLPAIISNVVVDLNNRKYHVEYTNNTRSNSINLWWKS